MSLTCVTEGVEAGRELPAWERKEGKERCKETGPSERWCA